MTELIEKRTKNVVYSGAGLFVFCSLVYLASLIIAGSMTLGTSIFPNTKTFLTTSYVLGGLIAGGFIFCLASLVLWTQSIWKEKYPGRVNNLFSQMFWLFLFPVGGQLFFIVILSILAWKQGKFVRSLVVFYTLLFVAILIYFPLFVKIPYLIIYMIPHPIAYLETACGILIGWLLCLGVVPAVMHMKYTRSMKCALATSFGLFFFAIVFSYLAVAYCDVRYERKKQQLREVGICVTNEDIRNAYLHGISPDPEWCKFVDEYNKTRGKYYSYDYAKPNLSFSERVTLLRKERDYDPEKVLLSLMNSDAIAGWDHNKIVYDAPVRQLLTDNNVFLNKLDKIFDSGKREPIKYALKYKNDSIGFIFPYLQVERVVACLYAFRIGAAINDGNRAEAMRLFRCAGKLSRSSADDVFLIGTLVSYAVEAIRMNALTKMFGAGILIESDIKEIEKDLVEMEKKLNSSAKTASMVEVSTVFNYIDTMKVGGEWFYRSSKHPYSLMNPLAVHQYSILRSEQAFVADAGKEYLAVVNRPDWNPADTQAVAHTYIGSKTPENREQVPFRMLSEMFWPSLSTMWSKERSMAALMRMARIACRVELFQLKNKRFPRSLSELPANNSTDPFNGKSFQYLSGELDIYRMNARYQQELIGRANGYRLWNVGKNRKDDGGKWGVEDDIFTVTSPNSFRAVETKK